MRRSALLVAFAVLLAACDWPMFGGNAGHTGYNPFERTINGANAYQLSEAWTAPLPTSQSRTSPIVAAGVVYVSRDKKLYAFAANGGTNCSGAPKKCSPLWTASFGANVGGAAAVANGFVYVPAGNTLSAFDAAGSTNCSGTPKTCAPVWTATGSDLAGEPVAAGGFVYIDMANLSTSKLYVFDGRGETGCTATNPRTCDPLWTAPGASGTDFDPLPAVGGGRVFVGDQVYDAAGQQNCSGAPKSCSPLWVNRAWCSRGAFCSVTYAVVSGGKVFYSATGQGPPFPPTPAASRLMAFDASGGAQCGGAPKTCQPLWSWDLSGSMSAAAVANGAVYVSTADFRSDTFQELGALYAFDADQCCGPIWHGDGADGAGLAVANGVLYMERRGNVVEPFASYFTAIDLSDRTVEQSVGYQTGITPPIIANGVVYFVDETALRAFELP